MEGGSIRMRMRMKEFRNWWKVEGGKGEGGLGETIAYGIQGVQILKIIIALKSYNKMKHKCHI